MKFAICNEVFEGWAIDDSIKFVADTGYDAIEIAPFTVAQYVTEVTATERHRIRAVAADNGIGISAVHWVLINTEGMYMTHTDPAVRSKTADYFCELVKFCADLGGEAIVVGSPKQRNLLPGVSFEGMYCGGLNSVRLRVFPKHIHPTSIWKVFSENP